MLIFFTFNQEKLVFSGATPALYDPGAHYLVAELATITTNLTLLLLVQCFVAPDKVIEVRLGTLLQIS